MHIHDITCEYIHDFVVMMNVISDSATLL